ncbi:MAG: peptidase U32 family protein [Halanaeroarchaeum sp.]
MNIFAPINSDADARDLVDVGADELYAGVIPTEWKGEYASVKPPNRRANEHSQVGSLEELERIARLCEEAGVELYITLNAHFYSQRQTTLIADLLEKLGEWDGITGYIIADVHLIDALEDEIGDKEVLVSTGATVFNGMSASFLADVGADGIHLPRHLTIDEIGQIRETAPDELDLYAFLLNRNCMCIDGNCTLLHNPPIEHENAERIPCFQEFSTRRAADGGESVTARLFANTHRDTEQACGVCSMFRFREMGLSGVKMVGRGLPLEEKVVQVRFLDRVRGLLDETESETEFVERAQSLVEGAGMTCSLDACYYPTVMGQ